MGNSLPTQNSCINQLDRCLGEVDKINTSNTNAANKNGTNPKNNMVDPSACHFKHIACLSGGEPNSIPKIREGFGGNSLSYLFLLIIIIIIIWFIFYSHATGKYTF